MIKYVLKAAYGNVRRDRYHLSILLLIFVRCTFDW